MSDATHGRHGAPHHPLWWADQLTHVAARPRRPGRPRPGQGAQWDWVARSIAAVYATGLPLLAVLVVAVLLTGCGCGEDQRTVCYDQSRESQTGVRYTAHTCTCQGQEKR